MKHALRMLSGADRGFTIVEVMVAALLLVVGVTGTLAMIDTAADRTVVNQGREAGTALARDVVEAAGNIPYDQATAANVTAALQAQPGLASAGGGWTIQRRGVTYTVAANACTVDDRVDGFGTAAAKGVGGFCGDSATTGSGTTADRNPDDMRRVTITVSWSSRGKAYTVSQAGVFFNPGNAVGPQVTNLTSAPTTIVTNTNPAPVTIDATATTSATHVKFWVDGSLKADVSTKTGSVWRFVWNTYNIPDATYVIQAQAYDSQDRSRGAYTITYKIDRNPATPPTNFTGGRNLRLFQSGSTSNSIVDLEWVASVDPDVYGYRVYRSSTFTSANRACEVFRDSASEATECSDLTPNTNQNSTYYVVALDRDNAGNARESTPVSLSFQADGNRPGAPPSVTAGYTSEGNVTLSWTAANPGNGAKAEPIAFYRIYRDGVLVGHRAGRTGGPVCPADCTWTARTPSASTSTWRVAAVDTKYGESDPYPLEGIVK